MASRAHQDPGNGNGPPVTQSDIPAPTGAVDLEAVAPGAWYAVIFLTLAASLSTIDRQVLAMMIGPIRRDLLISDSQMGLLGGLAFTLLYSLATVPLAWIADRGSRRAVITGGMAFWSLMTATCGIAQGFFALFVARMGVGLGEAALGPAAYSMLSDLFPRRRLPAAVGVFAAAPLIGVGLASLGGGQIMQALEHRPALVLPLIGTVKSWQAMFLALGLPGLAMALVGRLTLREPARRGAAELPAQAAFTLAGFVQFLNGRRMFLTLHFVAFIALSIQGWGLFFWIVEFLVRERGLPRARAGLIFGLMAFAFGLLGSIGSGRLAGLLQARGRADATLRLVLYSVIALAPLAIIMPLAPRAWQACALLAPITFLMGWPSGLGASALQFIAPNALKGRIIAVYLLVVNVTSLTLGPWLGGMISDHLFAGRSLGGSLALMAAVDYPVAIICLTLALRPFRQALEAAAEPATT